MRRALILLIVMLLTFGAASASATTNDAFTAVDGVVTISTTLQDVAEGTPVFILVLPAIIDDSTDEDVTLDKVKNLTDKSSLTELNAEYAKIVKTGENGLLEHTAVMKSSLNTGLCHVIINSVGSQECFSLGTFEHIGGNDKQELLEAINEADLNSYGTVIDKDMNGVILDDELIPAKNVLKKSYADVEYYSSLGDNNDAKSEFHAILYELKGNEDFDLSSLVEKFNESAVWMRLRTEENTLGVLNTYNDKYWNLSISEDSDFEKNLTEQEQYKILDKIKIAKFVDSTELESAFHEWVIIGMFKLVEDWETLETLISEEGSYASDFSGVREIIEEADLDEYELIELYNEVLDSGDIDDCETIEDIEQLFSDSLEEDSSGNGGSSNNPTGGVTMKPTGGYKGGYESSAKENPIKQEPSVKPGFKDINAEHWAYSYVQKLYNEGVINGVGEDFFAPSDSIKRQDFVKIIVSILNYELTEETTDFADVESGAYYAPYVAAAYKSGLVSGIGGNYFGIGNNIRREDAAVIMYRVLKEKGISVNEKNIEFADSNLVSEYAIDSVKLVSGAGIFSGDNNNNFNPGGNLTRAETCAIICRLTDILKGE